MKKTIALLFSFSVLLISLTACKPNGATANGDVQSEAPVYQELTYVKKGFYDEDVALDKLVRNTDCNIKRVDYDKDKKMIDFVYQYPKDTEPKITIVSDSGQEFAYTTYESRKSFNRSFELYDNPALAEERIQEKGVQIENVPQNIEYLLIRMDCTNVVTGEPDFYQVKVSYQSLDVRTIPIVDEESMNLHKQYYETRKKWEETFEEEREDLSRQLEELKEKILNYTKES